MNKNWIAWFEIPATDFDRSKVFYEKVLNIELQVLDLGDLKMALFPHQETGGGAICSNPHYTPSSEGVLIYLDSNPDLSHVLNRIESAGGKILMPKKLISPEHGYMALFIDTEGNRIALHSMH